MTIINNCAEEGADVFSATCSVNTLDEGTVVFVATLPKGVTVECSSETRKSIMISKTFKKAVLSQRELRDDAVNFDKYRILQRHHSWNIFWNTSTTVQNAEITQSTLIFTAVTQFHGYSQNSRHTTKITVKVTVVVNTRLCYSVNKCYNKCSCLRPLLCFRITRLWRCDQFT